MRIERIDAFEVNFVDSAARNEFKLDTSTGIGEKRIYVGHDEERYDNFFDFDNVEYCFTNKKDLIEYLDDARQEYMEPSQPYRANITEMYDSLVTETNNIAIESLKYSFRKKYDDQNRYFIVLNPTKENKENYNYIRNIVLPRVTRYCFVKIRDKDTGKLYIYMRPIFFNSLKVEEDYEVQEEVEDIPGENTPEKKKVRRQKQGKYRQALLESMPYCPFTLVADDRLLVACHIKPFRDCDTDEERYDRKNGITMTPTYHVLFDIGFISFEDDGTLLVSPFLSNITKKRLNLQEGTVIRLQTGSDKYLKYHRENIYCKMPNIILDEEDGILVTDEDRAPYES